MFSDNSGDMPYYGHKDQFHKKVARNQPHKGRCLHTGFASLEKITGAFKEGELVVIKGLPGTGKTVFALNMAWNIAKQYKEKVMFISFSNHVPYLINMLVAMEMEIPFMKIHTAGLIRAEIEIIKERAVKIKDIPVYLFDNLHVEQGSMPVVLEKAFEKTDPSIIFIDDFQSLCRIFTDFDMSSALNTLLFLKHFIKKKQIPLVLVYQNQKHRPFALKEKQDLSFMVIDKLSDELADHLIAVFPGEICEYLEDDEGNILERDMVAEIIKSRLGTRGTANFRYDLIYKRVFER